MSVLPSPSVAVASSDPQLLDDLIRFLEEIPEWTLVASVMNLSELSRVLAAKSPDVLLVSEGIAADLMGPPMLGQVTEVATVVVGRRETAAALKVALKIGARGFVVFPDEATQIRSVVEGRLGRKQPRSSSGTMTALWGPKGGSGTSVLCAHFAAGLVRIGLRPVLCDLDLDHGDQTAILGAAADHRTFLDLLRVKDELTATAVDSVAFTHAMGFKALLAPGRPGEAGLIKPADIVRTISAVRDLTGHVVVDLPSGHSELEVAIAEESSRLLIVITADVLSLRRARDAAHALRSSGIDESMFDFIVNRYIRGSITLEDVRAVVGKDPIGVVRLDSGIESASDRGDISESGIRQMNSLIARLTGINAEATRRVLGLRRKM